ncbi:hypothetical protein BJX62DRAFT_243124 [Aspergillus germanicus]
MMKKKLVCEHLLIECGFGQLIEEHISLVQLVYGIAYRACALTAVQLYDAACALFLGLVMFVFNIVTDAYSLSEHSIIRNSLLSKHQWFQQLIQLPGMDTVTVCPLFIETVKCLVHCEIPVIDCPHTDRIIVDRYAGICSSLLPHLYTLYQWNRALKHAFPNTRARHDLQVPDCLLDIEHTIRAWTPKTPAGFLEQYSDTEIQMMVTHARAYRLAALLLIHRLRSPFGVEDDTAQEYAGEIFWEIRCFLRSFPPGYSTSFPLVFPLLLASLGVQGPGEDILSCLPYSVQAVCASKLQSFVREVWRQRNNGFHGSWLELVDEYLNVAVLP